MEDFHTLFKPAGADSHESNTVPMGLVHVCLNFEHKSGEAFIKWIDYTVFRFTGQGRAGQLQKALQERFHAEVGESRAKEHRGELAVAHLLQVKFIAGAVQQLYVVL